MSIQSEGKKHWVEFMGYFLLIVFGGYTLIKLNTKSIESRTDNNAVTLRDSVKASKYHINTDGTKVSKKLTFIYDLPLDISEIKYGDYLICTGMTLNDSVKTIYLAYPEKSKNN